MITGRWGKPSQVLLDIVAEADGRVRGIVNPGRQSAPIREGWIDPDSGVVHLEGDAQGPEGRSPFAIDGRLDGRTLRLDYRFGEQAGHVDLVRVDEYRPPPPTLVDRVRPYLDGARRRVHGWLRPSGAANRRRLQARGESLDSIVFRDAVAADIPALAELHVTTWNATYRTTRGPSVELRTRQWTEVFSKVDRRDFVLVLEDRTGRLVGFTWGKPHGGEFAGELSKMYLRWEYHGLGLGRRMMVETARRFADRGIDSFLLFADAGNPTVGFYDRMGGERLVDERGRFHGAFGWRDVGALLR